MALIGTIDSGVSALRTFMKGLEVIGNNIANVNTTGFKSSSATYEDSFSNILQRSAASTATTSDLSTMGVGSGVAVAGISANFTQGSLSSTGVATDLGISGNGFFRIHDQADDSHFVTRSGDFRWDDQGYLVTQQGYHVEGVTAGGSIGDIKLSTPPTGTQRQSVTIDRAGNVVEFYSDGTSASTNKILLQDFRDPSALSAVGQNLFSGLPAAGPIGSSAGTISLDATANTAGTNGLGSIQSGTLELSNVDLTNEFANLITTQRSFEAGSRLVTVSDQVLQDIVDLKH